MDIYDVLDKYAAHKNKNAGETKYNYSRSRLKANYNQFVDTWKAYYKGDVAGINTDTGFNGESLYPIKRESMKLAKIISQKWVTMLFTEAFRVTLKNDIETEKFRQLEKNIDFRSKINQAAVSGYSMGTSALLASADIETATETETVTGGKVKLDVIKYDSIFPLVYDQNDIQSMAFVRQEQLKDKIIYTISIHSLENGRATVENIKATAKGDNVDFTAADTVCREAIFNNQMFCIIKPNIANDYTDVLPFGQSIFADSLSACADIDLAADQLRRDVQEGSQTTFVGQDLFLNKMENGKKKKVLDNTKGKFFIIPQALGEQGKDIKQLFEKYVPEIRTMQFWEVIKNGLNWACLTSGLGKDTLDIIPQQTATGVIHTAAEKMQNKSLHEQYLEGQVIKLVKALCELSGKVGSPIDSSEVNIVWEDSVIVDTSEQKRLSLVEIEAGVISKVEYRQPSTLFWGYRAGSNSQN